jgi:hypothetical protein
MFIGDMQANLRSNRVSYLKKQHSGVPMLPIMSLANLWGTELGFVARGL